MDPTPTLPIRVHLHSTYSEIEEVCLRIETNRPGLIGFDTESASGKNRVSLIQLSTDSDCYLLQVGVVFDTTKSLPPCLGRILKNPEIVKVGVGLDHDADLIQSSFGLIIRSGLDLQAIARTIGEIDLSLHGLALKYISSFPGKDPFGHKANWDHPLTYLQIRYAASDAYYSLILYRRMVLRQDLFVPVVSVDHQPELYRSWIQAYIKVSQYPLAFDSLVNYTVNSYGQWRKRYSEVDRRRFAEEELNYLTTILPFDPIKRKFIPASIS